MRYHNVIEAIFQERPNRFVAYCDLQGERVKCHVKNTGRCKELLIPNKTKVYLEDHGENTNRTTRYSLIKVWKGKRLINMDSQAPNQIAQEWLQAGGLFSNITYLKREKQYGDSRFDIYYERESVDQTTIRGFVEVKGVTLEKNNVALFPDAPTERGVKHIYELMKALQEGYEANILFVIQMKDVAYFTPNEETHQAFADALRQAHKLGVNVMAIDCDVTPDGITAGKCVDINLGKE